MFAVEEIRSSPLNRAQVPARSRTIEVITLRDLSTMSVEEQDSAEWTEVISEESDCLQIEVLSHGGAFAQS